MTRMQLARAIAVAAMGLLVVGGAAVTAHGLPGAHSGPAPAPAVGVGANLSVLPPVQLAAASPARASYHPVRTPQPTSAPRTAVHDTWHRGARVATATPRPAATPHADPHHDATGHDWHGTGDNGYGHGHDDWCDR